MPRIRMIKGGMGFRIGMMCSSRMPRRHRIKIINFFFVARQEETKWEAKGVGVGVAVAKGVRKVLKARQI